MAIHEVYEDKLLPCKVAVYVIYHVSNMLISLKRLHLEWLLTDNNYVRNTLNLK